MQTTLSPQNTALERNALFDASLQLISEGRFFPNTMREVAFRARMSAATASYIYQSKNQLEIDLVENVVDKITSVMNRAIAKGGTFKEVFFDLWYALSKFYVKNPPVISLLEQFGNLSSSSAEYPGSSPALVGFFSPANLPQTFKPGNAEVIAFLYHESIMTGVRMKLRNLSGADDIDMRNLPHALWVSMCIGG